MHNNRSAALRPLALSIPLAGLALLAQLTNAGAVQPGGPFAGFAGVWHGSGKVFTTAGKPERLSCRATYTVSDDSIALAQSMVCASDSYRFDIRTSIYTDGHAVRGTWQETTRNAAGNLEGSVAGNVIQAVITAPGFSAQLSVATNGPRQLVTVRPEGTAVSQMTITMSR